jgi:hypothetical protein
MAPPPQRHHHDEPSAEEVLLHNALCLLDVQRADGAKGLDFGPALFRSGGGKGAREVVWHHLYSVIEGRAAAKKVGLVVGCARVRACAAQRAARRTAAAARLFFSRAD